MAKCGLSIAFDRADGTYASGDKVTGVLEVRVDAECRCDRLTLTREWRTHGRGNKQAVKVAEEVLFQGVWQAGEAMSYEFAFDAPAWPPTYRGHLLNIDWYLRARADIPWAIDAKAEREFLLVPGKATGDAAPKYSPPPVPRRKQGLAVGCAALFGLIFLGAGLLAAISMTSQGQGCIGLPLGSLFMFVGVAIAVAGLRKPLAESRLGPVRVEFESRLVRLGSPARFTVAFSPRRGADITEVTAKVVGRENVISGSGTNKSTHLHGFHEERVVLASARRVTPGEHVEFQGQAPIPRGAPATFCVPDNEIQWLVEFHIAIAGWPDWTEEHFLTVVP